jgi:hypothetical protein
MNDLTNHERIAEAVEKIPVGRQFMAADIALPLGVTAKEAANEIRMMGNVKKAALLRHGRTLWVKR